MKEYESIISLILGGISSGKSEFAEKMLSDMQRQSSAEFYYFTPAGLPEDDEMQAKVTAHRNRRPRWLHTVECGADPGSFLSELKTGDTILFDSVGTLLGRLMMKAEEQESSSAHEAAAQFTSMMKRAAAEGLNIIFVSEEVGMELVALSSSGRTFQKTMGRLNQLIAASADEVYFVTAGIPQKLK
ncbi:MAG TPA: hypothetical protein DCO79_01095 [Spirochaeta sp.]|nr:hypothetical protein [Spirochaeta sp.]